MPTSADKQRLDAQISGSDESHVIIGNVDGRKGRW